MRGLRGEDLFKVLRDRLKLSLDDSHESDRIDLVVSFIVDEGHCDDEGTWFEETEAEITRVTIKAGEGR